MNTCNDSIPEDDVPDTNEITGPGCADDSLSDGLYSEYPSGEVSNAKLAAAALSALLQRPVITQQEYEERRHEPEYATVEVLDYERLAETVYTTAMGPVGDILGESGKKINLTLTSITGKSYVLNVGEDSYTEELKGLLEKCENFPVRHDRLVFVYKGRMLEERHRLSEYKVPHLYLCV